jgi:hypothetical protein
MKKVKIFLVAVLISAAGISQSIDLGVKAGINFSSINLENVGSSSVTGFQAGVFAGLKFSDKLGLQADVLYSKQGAELTVSNILEEIDLSYVNVPIVLKYYVFQGLNIQVGPQFGFVINDNIKEILKGQVDAKSADVSGVVGLGYDLPLGLRVDARYNFGFSDVLDGIVPGQTTEGDSSNKVFSIAVGYSLL